jgi:hypothetical protein
MGSIIFTLCDLYDAASEVVGVKSGLLLNYAQLEKIAVADWDKSLKGRSLRSMIRIRSEEAEELVRLIRVRIGNLPPGKRSPSYQELLNRFGSSHFEKYAEWQLAYLGGGSDTWPTTFAELRAKMQASGLSPEFLEEMSRIVFERFDSSIVLNPSIDVTEATPLETLFHCEAFPMSDNTFLDQKFLDYLAVNGSEIETIHWRNFERFCAEYFQRAGYHVVLGAGGNDGGIDIRAYSERSSADPQIIIQCKRYKADHKVEIETVKAFYTDVIFQRAQTGLIATTSAIAPGGKKTVAARNYPVTFAEKEKIKQWARHMWRFQ